MALTIFTGMPTSTPGAASAPTTKSAVPKASGPSAGTVIVSLSAAALQSSSASQQSGSGSDLIAQWRDALGDREKSDQSALTQLEALNKQMRSSRHDDASQRLQQLLAQYRLLRMFGGNAKALADLAKQIKAAASDLSASGDSASTDPSTDAAAGTTTVAAPTDATGETTSTVPAESAASSAASTDTPDTGDVASMPTASDAAVAAAAPGDQGDDADPSTSGATDASIPPPGQRADAAWQQLVQQVNDAGARAQRKANDELLLTQARAAIADIERMAKQAEEAKRHKAAAHRPAPTGSGGLDKVI